MRKCKHENCNGDCTRTECGGKCSDIPNCETKRYKQALEEIREIINKELPIKVLQKNGTVPMIYYSDYMNEVKFPILKVLESEEE